MMTPVEDGKEAEEQERGGEHEGHPGHCHQEGEGPPSPSNLFKGSVSRKLRPLLLYVIRKLFIKPLSAYHFHKDFLKGYATITFKKLSV